LRPALRHGPPTGKVYSASQALYLNFRGRGASRQKGRAGFKVNDGKRGEHRERRGRREGMNRKGRGWALPQNATLAKIPGGVHATATGQGNMESCC